MSELQRPLSITLTNLMKYISMMSPLLITFFMIMISIFNNTLIIYTSDNGPWLNFGSHAGSSGELRGGKFDVFEGETNVEKNITDDYSGSITWNYNLIPRKDGSYNIDSIEIPFFNSTTSTSFSSLLIARISIGPVSVGNC